MCVYVTMCVCFCVKMCVNIYLSINMFACLCVCQPICMSPHVFVCVNMCVCVYRQVSYTSVTLAVCIHPNPCTSVTLVVCIHQSPRVARSHTVSIVSTSCSRLCWLPLRKACLLSMIAGELLVYETTCFTNFPKFIHQNMYTRSHCLHTFICNANNSSFHRACCGLSVFLSDSV